MWAGGREVRPLDTAQKPLGPEAVEPQEETRAQKHPHVWGKHRPRSPCGRGTCGPRMNVGQGGEGRGPKFRTGGRWPWAWESRGQDCHQDRRSPVMDRQLGTRKNMSVLLIPGGRRAEGGAPVCGQGAPLAPGQGEAHMTVSQPTPSRRSPPSSLTLLLRNGSCGTRVLPVCTGPPASPHGSARCFLLHPICGQRIGDAGVDAGICLLQPPQPSSPGRAASTTENNFPMVLGARHPKARGGRGWFLLGPLSLARRPRLPACFLPVSSCRHPSVYLSVS